MDTSQNGDPHFLPLTLRFGLHHSSLPVRARLTPEAMSGKAAILTALVPAIGTEESCLLEFPTAEIPMFAGQPYQ